MFEELSVGLAKSVSMVVTEKDTALAVGSGSLEVLATPKLVALMENAAADLTDEYLPPEWTSVGFLMRVSHVAPTPVGMEVRVEAELIEIDDRQITFMIKAYDDCDEVGIARHERFIVERKRFQSKADAKRHTRKKNS